MFHNNIVGFIFFVCFVTFETVHSELSQKKYDVKVIEKWPNSDIVFGQLSAIAFDNDNNVVVFHRGHHVWDEGAFWPNNTYARIQEGPIHAETVVVLDNLTGTYLRSWGSKIFYMPHGLTIDADGNVWLTDVALHQVFKYGPRGEMSLLTLGTKFIPGSDDAHFCKPTSVAVLENGDFFVADGYCNSRIIKYTRTGLKVTQWGVADNNGAQSVPPAHYSLFVPHALAVINSAQQVCVADREHGRIVCYGISGGEYKNEYKFPNSVGYRLFSLAYTPVDGGKFFVVNGPNYQPPYYSVKGFIINIPKNTVEASFGNFQNPHDIAVNANGSIVYVVEYRPSKLHKIEIRSEATNRTMQHVEKAELRVATRSSTFIGHFVLALLIAGIILTISISVYYFGFRRKDLKRYGKILEDDGDITESASLFPQEMQD